MGPFRRASLPGGRPSVVVYPCIGESRRGGSQRRAPGDGCCCPPGRVRGARGGVLRYPSMRITPFDAIGPDRGVIRMPHTRTTPLDPRIPSNGVLCRFPRARVHGRAATPHLQVPAVDFPRAGSHRRRDARPPTTHARRARTPGGTALRKRPARHPCLAERACRNSIRRMPSEARPDITGPAPPPAPRARCPGPRPAGQPPPTPAPSPPAARDRRAGARPRPPAGRRSVRRRESPPPRRRAP